MERPVIWIGSSLKDLRKFPEDVQDEIGYILYHVQIGEKHHKIKRLKGFSSIIEITIRHKSEVKTEHNINVAYI